MLQYYYMGRYHVSQSSFQDTTNTHTQDNHNSILTLLTFLIVSGVECGGVRARQIYIHTRAEYGIYRPRLQNAPGGVAHTIQKRFKVEAGKYCCDVVYTFYVNQLQNLYYIKSISLAVLRLFCLCACKWGSGRGCYSIPIRM